MIAYSNRSLRRNSNNSKMLRELVYERIKGRLKLRISGQGVQLGLRLGYQGRRRRRERLLIEPHEQLLVELNNNSNKLKKLPKRVRGVASRLLLEQLQKRELLRMLKVVERP